MSVRRPAPTLATLPSGVKLHYRIQGEPGAPWMVLLNGLLSDATMWAGVLPFLSPHFRILTFDCRGQGRSGAPTDAPYSVATHAQDVWELLKVLEIHHPWLAGLSNGSFISLELLVAHPGAFQGAVLTSTVPNIDFTTRLRIQHWVQCLDLGGPLMQFDSVAPYLWGDRFLEQRYAVLRAYQQTVLGQKSPSTQDPYTGIRFQMLGILDWDIRSRLYQILDQVLLLAGAEDLLTPPWKCLETAHLISHAQFEMVPGVGHAYPVESPKAYAERVFRFMSGTKQN